MFAYKTNTLNFIFTNVKKAEENKFQLAVRMTRESNYRLNNIFPTKNFPHNFISNKIQSN